MKQMAEVGPGYWTIRGQFRLAGLLDIGTQAGLVRLGDGRFVLLDSYTLAPDVRAEVERITGGPDKMAAILNLHPFHTLHARAMHAQFPGARLYGTARHKRKFPDLPWQLRATEDPELWPAFAPDLAFTVPEGVDFIPGNEHLHFASVMALHRPSGVIHVDDTFNGLPPGRIGRALGRNPRISFHMTLAKVLQKRPGAAAAFRNWAEELIDSWGDATRICLAHKAVLDAETLGSQTLRPAMQDALARVAPKLAAHEAKYG